MRISVVIDNYNYQDYVARAIDSALAQTHPDMEVIVVDDGSRDGSVDVIRRYADRVLLIDKPNGGQGSAYNAGFARTTGDLVVFLDADDWLYPQAAAEIVALWRPGVSKVQFRLDMVDKAGTALGRQVPRDMHDQQALALLCAFGTYGSPPGSGNAFHTSYLRQVLPMDEAAWRIGADSVPILLAPMYGAVVSASQTLGAYRLHQPLDNGALFFGNSSSGLADEHDRVNACKRMVEAGLRRKGLPHDATTGTGALGGAHPGAVPALWRPGDGAALGRQRRGTHPASHCARCGAGRRCHAAAPRADAGLGAGGAVAAAATGAPRGAPASATGRRADH